MPYDRSCLLKYLGGFDIKSAGRILEDRHAKEGFESVLVETADHERNQPMSQTLRVVVTHSA